MSPSRKTSLNRKETAVARVSSSDARDLLAAIVESSEDAIYSRNLAGTVMTWNRAAERVFGYAAHEIIGRSSTILLPPDRLDETRKIIERVRRGEKVEHFETVRVCKNGSPLALSLTASPIRNRRGRVVGVSTIARDISTEREVQARFLDAGERERRRIGRDLHDSLGQHISGMELLCRTLSRSLLRRGLPEARLAELLVRQLKNALAEVRALSRGMVPVVETPDGLMLALEDLATTMRSMFRVNCVFECDEPVLIADHSAANHMFRIAQEAVTNAIRHGRAKRIIISLGRKLTKLSLEIQDRGQGFRANDTKTGGMGMRVMRHRASRLGGTLKVVSTPPKGVLVCCVVPQARLLAAPDLLVAAKPAPARPAKKTVKFSPPRRRPDAHKRRDALASSK